MLDFDIVIIGAGPGGLTAALNLVKSSNLSVLLIDRGRIFQKRICPVDQGKLCKGCKSVCNVSSGFGGAIHYGDGLKLSKFPSGRRLADKLGSNAMFLMDKGLNLLFPTITNDRFFYGTNSLGCLKVKEYPVLELKSSEVKKSIEIIYSQLTCYKNIKFQSDTEVLKIENSPLGYFSLTTKLLNAVGDLCKITAKYIIVAVGRCGYGWWHKHIDELNLAYKKPTISVGLRFETPPGVLRAAAELHPDFKISSFVGDTKIKSFCFCAGKCGGRLKFIDYGSHVLLDGHSHSDGIPLSENFALLAQLYDENKEPRSFEWIDRNLLTAYRKLRTERPGKPVVQWFPDFKNKKTTIYDVDKIYQSSGIKRQISDLAAADISGIIDDNIHRGFCETLENIFSSIHPTKSLKHLQEQTIVTALELEGFWDEMELTESMESTLSNLYVIGDTTGLAQGILQASTTGVAATESILSKELS